MNRRGIRAGSVVALVLLLQTFALEIQPPPYRHTPYGFELPEK